MTGIYEKLAERFDEWPNGFPSTKSGVELKILEKIFSHEDAEMFLKLKLEPETVEVAAERLGLSVEKAGKVLDGMAGKGQISCSKKGGRHFYSPVPFVIGVYELQLNHLDEELAALFKEYMPYMARRLGAVKPAVTRVVPVNKAIEAEHEVLRYEDVHRMINEAKSFAVRECICRKQTVLEGSPCGYSLEVCLGFSREENAYDDLTYSGRTLTREESLEVLDRTAKEGLIYCTYNVQDGHTWVCSCCACCCGLLRSIKNNKTPYVLTGSNFRAEIDQEVCEICGVCADERCMMDAIIQKDGQYFVQSNTCIGCGVCTLTCPTGAIALKRRSAEERIEPPADQKAWKEERIANR